MAAGSRGQLPEELKFIFGQRVTDHAVNILELLVEATYSSRKAHLLADANVRSKPFDGCCVSRTTETCSVASSMSSVAMGWRKADATASRTGLNRSDRNVQRPANISESPLRGFGNLGKMRRNLGPRTSRIFEGRRYAWISEPIGVAK